jgi:Arc/MetJ-type ribon-helix-helix transcriptional regulator
MSSQIVNISLPKDLVKKIDSAAKGSYASRSEFIRQAVVSRLRAEDTDGWAVLESTADEISDKAAQLGYTTDGSVVRAVKEVRKAKRSS